jgi:uncharacterized membrane protein YfcA
MKTHSFLQSAGFREAVFQAIACAVITFVGTLIYKLFTGEWLTSTFAFSMIFASTMVWCAGHGRRVKEREEATKAGQKTLQ